MRLRRSACIAWRRSRLTFVGERSTLEKHRSRVICGKFGSDVVILPINLGIDEALSGSYCEDLRSLRD